MAASCWRDAASLINPLTGEGIYYAVLSGRLAGTAAIVPGSAAAGAAYRRALRHELGLHLATTSVLSRLSRSPEIFDAGLALAGGATRPRWTRSSRSGLSRDASALAAFPAAAARVDHGSDARRTPATPIGAVQSSPGRGLFRGS